MGRGRTREDGEKVDGAREGGARGESGGERLGDGGEGEGRARPRRRDARNVLAKRVEADIAEMTDRPAVVAVATAKSAPAASLGARSPAGRDALPEDLKPLTPGRSPPGPSDVRASVREPPPPRLTSFSPL